jgi:hypothetical protein
MGPKADLVHQVPGRIRIRVPSERGNSAFFAEVSRQLGECPGVTGVETNPVTASVLLRHASPLAGILGFAKEHGVFLVEEAKRVPLQKLAAANLGGVSRNLQLIAGEEIDLDSAILVMLTGMAIHQAIKGNIVAPAATLVWYALVMLRAAEIKS